MSHVRMRSTLLAATASALLVVLPVLATPPADGAATVPEVAPYFEPTGTHTANLNTAVTKHGLKSFTAAFVLGKKCVATWDDGSTITTTDARSALVKKAKTAGALPIISFGGQSGNELAKVCTTTSNLVTAYTGVINKFGATKIDFDIEGAANVNATAVNTRRFQAIKALETKFPSLKVSLTLPVGYSGLETAKADGDAVTLLKLAKTQKARIDVINLMTMDYGDANSNMGAAATTSATKALAQIKKIWTTYTYNNIGITPMIGLNDTPTETFTYADAETVVAFAKSKGVRRLAFWAINRDQSCGAGDQAPGTCTNLSQDPLDYTDAFLG